MMAPMGHFLDLDAWPRAGSFRFFLGFEIPFFNLCAEVRVTPTLAWCRASGASFALASWFLCQEAVNELEPFRYRLRGQRVWVHDTIYVATTVLEADETFSFRHLPHAPTFDAFVEGARRAMESDRSGAPLDDRPDEDGLIHGSTLPWLRFTSVAHARSLSGQGSVPKIVFGRATEVGDEVVMPVSVEVHHALMDGLHVARYFALIERMMAHPEERLTRP